MHVLLGSPLLLQCCQLLILSAAKREQANWFIWRPKESSNKCFVWRYLEETLSHSVVKSAGQVSASSVIKFVHLIKLAVKFRQVPWNIHPCSFCL